MALRVVRAAKDYQEATHGLAKQLETCISDSNGSLADYVLQSLFPLLSLVVGEICATKPENPSVFLAIWLLEECGAPAGCLQSLRAWASSGEVGSPFRGAAPREEPRVAQAGPPLKPPCDSGTRRVGPKTRKLGGAPGPGGSPKAEHSDRPSLQPGAPHTGRGRGSDVAEGVGDGGVTAAGGRVGLECGREASGSGGPSPYSSSVGDGMEASAAVSSRRSSGRPAPERAGRRKGTYGVLEVSPPQLSEMVELLSGVPEFKELEEADLNKVAGVAECIHFDPDEIICHIGLEPKAIYVIKDGIASVAVPQVIGRKCRGEVFGQASLNHMAGSSQQVTANTGLVCLKVDAAEVAKLDIKTRLKKCNEVKRAQWSDNHNGLLESLCPDNTVCPATGWKIVAFQRTKFDRDVIATALMNNKVLSELMDFTEEHFDLIAQSVYLIHVPRDGVLMHAGDRGNAMFVVQDGLLDASLDGYTGLQFKIRSTDSFGELALLYDTPRMATVTAVRDSKLWVLTREHYHAVTQISYRARMEKYTEMVERVPCFQHLREGDQLHVFAGALEDSFFVKGDDVCVQGEDQGLFFIINEGQCEVLQDGARIRTLSKGDWYGEEQMFNNSAMQHTVRVISDAASALSLEHASWLVVNKAISKMCQQGAAAPLKTATPVNVDLFDVMAECAPETLLRRLDRLRLSTKNGIEANKLPSSASNSPNVTSGHGEGSLQRLVKVGALGEGAFGSVMLMQDRITRKMYAMKVLFKEQIQAQNLLQCVRNERTLMMLLDSDFVVQLYRTYEDAKHYFFIQEAVLGGELFETFDNNSLFGQVPHVMFYIGCVLMGLEHMHSRRVIYRDLKLENCLLNETGYLKLTDLGIAKLVIGRTYTVCGTTDYFAPETLRQVGYNRAVDWWACGVLLFIMLAGRSPFDAPEVTQIYKNILKGFSKVSFPPSIPADAIDVIKSLCCKEPEERVTMQKGGVDKLKAMPFFLPLDWDALSRQQVCPPFTPSRNTAAKAASKVLEKDVEYDVSEASEWDGGALGQLAFPRGRGSEPSSPASNSISYEPDPLTPKRVRG